MEACPGLRSGIASRVVTPAPKLVFPAKAGIQKGRGETNMPWKNSGVPQAIARPWSFRPPTLVFLAIESMPRTQILCRSPEKSRAVETPARAPSRAQYANE